MGKNSDLPQEPNWGPNGAKAYLHAALVGSEELKNAYRSGDRARQFFCLIGFFGAAYGVVEALHKYDSVRNPKIDELRERLFSDVIKDDPVYQGIIRAERHGLLHANPGGAINPNWPDDVVRRHEAAGRTFTEILFDEWVWPDGEFKGKSLDEIVDLVLTRLTTWVDSIDRELGDWWLNQGRFDGDED